MTLRESAYDERVDSARDFRTLLSAMSRPAMIHDLGPLSIHPPAGLSSAEATRKSGLTGNAEVFSASFLFFSSADFGEQQLAAANRGDLHYPDNGATIIAQLADLSGEAQPDSIRVHAQGPGVDGSAVFYAKGLHPVWLATLRSNNAEYPLGVDVIFTCGTRIVCLPRSTNFNWG